MFLDSFSPRLFIFFSYFPILFIFPKYIPCTLFIFLIWKISRKWGWEIFFYILTDLNTFSRLCGVQKLEHFCNLHIFRHRIPAHALKAYFNRNFCMPTWLFFPRSRRSPDEVIACLCGFPQLATTRYATVIYLHQQLIRTLYLIYRGYK